VFRANRAVALAKKTGTPLPHVDFLRDWYKDEGGREIYQGELVMVAGRPGALKSFFSLAFAQATGLHALYMSADSDAATQTARLAANITGHQVRDIRQQMVENPDAETYYANALAPSKVTPNGTTSKMKYQPTSNSTTGSRTSSSQTTSATCIRRQSPSTPGTPSSCKSS
jgi:hypothetical protein